MSRRRLTLIALMVFFAAGTTLWIALNRAPPQWDDSWYLTNSLVLFDSLSDGLPAYIAKYLTLLRTKPPLIAVLPTPFYLVLGRRVHAAYLVNVAILPAFFCLVYLVGRRLRNARTGLLAVYICATMPLLYGLSHWFLVEYSLAAFVCLTVFLACLAVDRPDWRIFGCLGITCGLGVLLKISFPVYVLPVLLYVCVRLWRNSGWSWRTVSAFLIPAVLLPLPWYAVNYRQALGRAVFSGFSQTAAKLYGTPIKTYLLTVVNAGTSTYYIILFVALLLLLALTRNMEAWWRRWANDGRLIVALWLLPFLVFLFGRNKDLRFIAPILPAVALIIASLLDRWPPALTALALTFPLLACLHASFGVIGGMAFATHDLHFANTFDRQSWPLDQILRPIAGPENRTVMLGTDLPQFNADNFALVAERNHLPLRMVTSAYQDNLSPLLTQLHASDFFVYKDGGEMSVPGTNSLQQPLLHEVTAGGAFRELASGVPLPDGSRARIFQNSRRQTVIIPAGLDRVQPYEFDFGNQIELTGLTFEQRDDTLELHLRWLYIKTPDRDYDAFVHILDSDQHLAGQLDHALVKGSAGDTELESLSFVLDPRLTHGACHLRLGLFDAASGERLPARIVSGSGFTLTDNGTAVLTPEAARSAR